MSESTSDKPRRKYSAEFKRTAVDRMAAGESATKLARELDIRCKFLYLWRATGKGSAGAAPGDGKAAKPDSQESEITRLKAKIAALERLNGQQAAELDFFAAALRNIEESRPTSDVDSGNESTP